MQKALADDNKNVQQSFFPDKLFYKIGEVSKYTGIEPYVLRYWETEFQFLRPRKSKSGQRIYVKKDLELIIRIKELLYNERLTIEGVRRRLSDAGMGRKPQTAERAPEGCKFTSSDSPLEYTKRRLREILSRIS